MVLFNHRVIPITEMEVLTIPAKNGKPVCAILNPTEEKIVNELAMEIYQNTGKFSKSEAIRQLINAGHKALKKKRNV